MSNDNILTWRSAVNKNDELQSTTAHLLLVISCYINVMGTGAYPSVKTLAQNTKLSERSVCTHIQLAIKHGFLRVNKHGFGGKKWKRNEYFACFPKPEGTEPNDISAKNGAKSYPQGTEPNDNLRVKGLLSLTKCKTKLKI